MLELWNSQQSTLLLVNGQSACETINLRGAARLRLRLSLLPARLELNDPNDPCDCDEWFEK